MERTNITIFELFGATSTGKYKLNKIVFDSLAKFVKILSENNPISFKNLVVDDDTTNDYLSLDKTK